MAPTYARRSATRSPRDRAFFDQAQRVIARRSRFPSAQTKSRNVCGRAVFHFVEIRFNLVLGGRPAATSSWEDFMQQFLRDGIAVAGVAALLAAGFGAAPGNAQASDYPRRAITFIVGFAPGGGIDTFARVVAQELTEQAGFSVVIENRAGAASNIAARAVAGAAPDGYTLLFTGNSYAINQTLYKNPGYATGDLRPVVFVAIDSQAFAVHAANPARSLPEFLEAGKTMPFNFGFGGSSARIGAEYVFNVLAKANATGVPFQSGAPALNALLGRHVDIIPAPVA